MQSVVQCCRSAVKRMSQAVMMGLLVPGACFALPIDRFETIQVVTNPAVGGGNPVISVVSGPGILGRYRTVSSSLISGDQMIDQFTGYTYNHVNGLTAHGVSTIIWDGDSDGSTLNVAGLGSINLLADGATAFDVESVQFELLPGIAAEPPPELTVRMFVYSGATYHSTATAKIAVTKGRYFSIPFSDFVTSGVDGPADFAKVGAIVLQVETSCAGTSFTIQCHIKTNGSCSLESGIDAEGRPACSTPIPTATSTPTVTPVAPTATPTVVVSPTPENPTVTATPTATPQATATASGSPVAATPTVTPTSPPACLQGVDACGVCGGKETNPEKCFGSKEECKIVNPTDIMFDSANKLIQILNVISKTFDSDVSRARNDAACSSLGVARKERWARSLEGQIRREIGSKIVRQIKVCGQKCVLFNFTREVRKVRGLLHTYGVEAKRLARSVVRCAHRPNGNEGILDRTDDRVNRLIRRAESVRGSCKVCKPN